MKSKAVLIVSILIIAVVMAVMTIKPRQILDPDHFDTKTHRFELIDPEQNTINISDLRGSVVFINFWATWCSSCIDELPSIEAMYKNFSGNPNFRVVTILYKDDLKRALAFMKMRGLTFPVYLNPDESAARMFGITGVPETFIIDKSGKLRHKVIGPADWDSPGALEIFQKLMTES